MNLEFSQAGQTRVDAQWIYPEGSRLKASASA